MGEIVNPFADYGPLVFGARFIGRSEQLGQIWHRVVESGGNLSIIGERRVGKSSLAYQALVVAANKLRARGTIPVWIDVGTYSDAARLFSGIVKWCCWELEDCSRLARSIREAAEDIVPDTAGFDYDRVQFFFQQIQRQSLRIALILDEFDQSSIIFRNDATGFHQLRALSYRQQSTLVTISRRTVQMLEQRAGADTPFARTFEPCYLGMFSDEEVEQLWLRIKTLGLPLLAVDRERWKARCGGHPFLLAMVASALVEHYRLTNQAELDAALTRTEPEFISYYEELVERLEADGWLHLVSGLLAGEPTKPGDIPVELLQTAVIHKDRRDRYIGFSQHFSAYLEHIRPAQTGTLTERELAILRLTAAGQQNKEIARILDISANTVKFHLRNICSKLGVSNRGEATARARELQLLP